MRFQKSFLIPALLFFQAQIYCTIQVVTDESLPPEELDYVAKREKTVVNQALQQFCGLDSAQTKFPRIALLISGGGFRSMINGIGMLAGAQQSGLYDCTSYMAGVSGGTWAIAPLSLRYVSPKEYATVLKKRVCSAIEKDGKHRIISKLNKLSKIELVDCWGHFIGERLLGDLPGETTVTFDNIRKNLAIGNLLPFPIFASVIGQTAPDYESLEVSPFWVYSKFLGGSIPTVAFGNKFDKGTSNDEIHEKPLEFFLGLFGSAFCLTLGDALINVLEGFLDDLRVDLLPHDVYTKFIDHFRRLNGELPLYKERLCPAEIPNYSFGMPESTKMHGVPSLQLIDAGYGSNLPIIPLLRPGRNIDIFVICDASSDTGGHYDYKQLRLLEDYVTAIGAPFPSLERFKSIHPNLKIFYAEDPRIPMIIYFEDSKKFPTTKMQYTEEEFDSLLQDSFSTFTDHDNINLIVEAIKKKANLPNKFDDIPDQELSCSCCSIS